MKTLYMVRHAASLANEGEFWPDGPGSIPLSQSGHAAAREFAASWNVRPDLIVVSRYTRSVQTATPLAERFALPLLTLDVREFTFFDFRFTQQEYAVDRKRETEAYWSRLDPLEKQGGPDAENFNEFIERCQEFRRWVQETPFEHCVCVTHGFTAHSFRALIAGVDLPARDFMAYLRDTLPGNAYANLEVEEYSFETTSARK